MISIRIATTFLMLLLLASSAAAEGVDLREGTHEGADFIISVPSNWNGGPGLSSQQPSDRQKCRLGGHRLSRSHLPARLVP
jgi:hypothetical protein